MTGEIQRIVNILESGEVERYHAAPGVKPQTDGLHAWGVAMIVEFILGPETGYELRYLLMTEALHHDEGELMTGDIPYTAKRYDEALGEKIRQIEAVARTEYFSPPRYLPPRGEAILKVADTLDGFIWCAKWQTGDGVLGLHRGKVKQRWVTAYNTARVKFARDLHRDEWDRTDKLFTEYGGIFKS